MPGGVEIWLERLARCHDDIPPPMVWKTWSQLLSANAAHGGMSAGSPSVSAQPSPRTSGQRSRDSERRRRARTLHLPGAVLDQIATVRERDGDASLVACVTRLVAEAVADRRVMP
jgi:hypothetical protein